MRGSPHPDPQQRLRPSQTSPDPESLLSLQSLLL